MHGRAIDGIHENLNDAELGSLEAAQFGPMVSEENKQQIASLPQMSEMSPGKSAPPTRGMRLPHPMSVSTTGEDPTPTAAEQR